MCVPPYINVAAKICYKHSPSVKKSIDIIFIENGQVLFESIEVKHIYKETDVFINIITFFGRYLFHTW